MATGNNFIDLPLDWGKIIGAAKTTAGNLIAAVQQVPVSWRGSQLSLLTTTEPSFQFAHGVAKVHGETTTSATQVTPYVLPAIAEIPDQEVVASQEAGKFDELIATYLANVIQTNLKVVEYGMIHGVDKKSGAAVPAGTNPSLVSVATDTDIDPEISILDNIKVAFSALNNTVPSAGFVTANNYYKIYDYATTGITAASQNGLNLFGVPININGSLPKGTTPGVTSADVEFAVGDFSGGAIFGALPLNGGQIEEIRYGDPAGRGSNYDLRNVNKVAYRVEIGYAWGFVNDAFSILNPAPEEV